MALVTAKPPSGDKNYSACLVIVDRYRKIPILLPFYKDNTDMYTALLLFNRFISHTGLFKNIISEIDPNVKYPLCSNIHRFFGTKLSFYASYHPHNDGLSERIILTLEDIIRRFCAYGLDPKDSDGLTPD
ncbi:hypothetical protein O181_070425 [Austropuccinia psidii MF-1]|uniref:Integrase catalytic domain-containing protein n=1 Tax=Austropuccinia psidii MF-1 TaxID=1389203 RepID=A0A9Q3I918_9BASI|nr:hypothetical protein [Austropuccinia psidii MF-1]